MVQKTAREVLKDHFGTKKELNAFVNRILESHLTSDEFAEQTSTDRKNDIFSFKQLKRILHRV